MSFLGWIIIFILLFAGVLTAYAAHVGAPYVPTPMTAVKAAMNMVNLKQGEVLLDAGCGDGRIVIEASKRGARAIGYELSPFLWVVAKLNLWAHRSEGKILFGNAFEKDLSRYDVIFLFLMPNTLPNFLKEIRKKAKAGTRIITYAFPLKELEPEQTEIPFNCAPVRLYILK